MADKKAKEMKNLVEAILSQKGINYDVWLYQQHLQLIAENSETVLNALKQVNQ